MILISRVRKEYLRKWTLFTVSWKKMPKFPGNLPDCGHFLFRNLDFWKNPLIHGMVKRVLGADPRTGSGDGTSRRLREPQGGWYRVAFPKLFF
jgi:hypothetical protein